MVGLPRGVAHAVANPRITSAAKIEHLGIVSLLSEKVILSGTARVAVPVKQSWPSRSARR
ncbi:hypothetical protein AMJ85_04955 [candidate division BRC1 bacterium SM23_51]|nr:MAG: hypothetical protein AMJ85_04955 [candidate division BRC1 bacterium SM23_51]